MKMKKRGGRRPGAGRPKTRTEKWVNRTVSLPVSIDADLKASADEQGIPVSSLLRELINDHLAQEK